MVSFNLPLDLCSNAESHGKLKVATMRLADHLKTRKYPA